MKKVLLFGGLLMDRYIVTGRYPRRGEDTLIREEFQQPGGCPFNVAKTLQNLGVEPVIWSALSDDPMGRELRAVLAAEGLGDRVFVNQADTAEALALAGELAALLPWPVCAGSLQGGKWTCLSSYGAAGTSPQA